MQRRFFLRAAVLIGFAFTANACASSPRASASTQPRTTLRVENQGFTDMVIYLLQGGGGTRIRLGTANGNSTSTFTIPQQYVFGVSSLQFLADPVGGTRTPVSDQIQVSPGDQVRLIIPPR